MSALRLFHIRDRVREPPAIRYPSKRDPQVRARSFNLEGGDSDGEKRREMNFTILLDDELVRLIDADAKALYRRRNEHIRDLGRTLWTCPAESEEDRHAIARAAKKR
jgi:hypothetical protein